MDQQSSADANDRTDVELGRHFARPRPHRLLVELSGDVARVSWALDDAPTAVALTRAERDVLARIATGASNAEIAAARSVSVRTVANQVAKLFRKLNASSRYELLQWTALASRAPTIVEREGKAVLARRREPDAPEWLALTAQEREVVWLFAQALPYKNIAYELDVSLGTVVGRIRRAMRKLGASSRVELLQLLGLG